jgi:integral membrane sensor domain MASE1
MGQAQIRNNMDKHLKYLSSILIVAAFYIVAAKLGLLLALSVKQITSVWPPSGMALVVLILFGYRMWPGVLLGAFIANLLTYEPALVALGIAVGNTLEALIGAWLLNKITRIHPSLDRVRDIVGVSLLAAVVSTIVAASIGTTSLALGHLLSWSAQPKAWLLWWFGDMSGDIVFASILFVWLSQRPQIGKRRLEFLALAACTMALCSLVFFGPLPLIGRQPHLAYAVLPLVIWSALRFKQHGVTMVALIMSISAVIATAAAKGPFAGMGTVEQQLVQLLTYIVLITVSGLVLGAVVLQREQYALKLEKQAQQLSKARDILQRELSAKNQHEAKMQKSQQQIVKVLDTLLDKPFGGEH